MLTSCLYEWAVATFRPCFKKARVPTQPSRSESPRTDFPTRSSSVVVGSSPPPRRLPPSLPPFERPPSAATVHSWRPRRSPQTPSSTAPPTPTPTTDVCPADQPSPPRRFPLRSSPPPPSSTAPTTATTTEVWPAANQPHPPLPLVAFPLRVLLTAGSVSPPCALKMRCRSTPRGRRSKRWSMWRERTSSLAW